MRVGKTLGRGSLSWLLPGCVERIRARAQPGPPIPLERDAPGWERGQEGPARA